jgi:hypothetical protein
MWHLNFPIDLPYFIEGMHRWTQTSMNAEYLIINDGTKSKEVKDICAVSPNIDCSVFSDTLIIETIDLCDLPALVVSSDKCHTLGVSDFQSQEEQECLH